MIDFQKNFEEYHRENKSPAGMAEASFLEYKNKYSIGSVFNPSQFLVGKIYTFYYDDYPKKYGEFINKRPIVFFLGPDKVSKTPAITGFDIILIPPIDRLNFFKRIFFCFESIIERNMRKIEDRNERGQEPLKFEYSNFESILSGIKYKGSYSRYKVEKIMNVHEITYDQWHKLVYLNTRSIEGTTIEEIYKKSIKEN